jgi:hypothetical protein
MRCEAARTMADDGDQPIHRIALLSDGFMLRAILRLPQGPTSDGDGDPRERSLLALNRSARSQFESIPLVAAALALSRLLSGSGDALVGGFAGLDVVD